MCALFTRAAKNKVGIRDKLLEAEQSRSSLLLLFSPMDCMTGLNVARLPPQHPCELELFWDVAWVLDEFTGCITSSELNGLHGLAECGPRA